MSRRIPPVIRVDFSKTTHVEAKLPIEFDRSGWFVEFHGSYMTLRRARTRETYSIDYESLISRAIQADVEARRRSKRARGR